MDEALEFFLVFLLGIAVSSVVLFIARPGLFSRSQADFSLFEIMFEESVTELEERQREFLAEIEKERALLVELHDEIRRTLEPENLRSPKVLAVLRLAKEGRDVLGIAKELGLGTGEVRLILDLNQDETLDESG